MNFVSRYTRSIGFHSRLGSCIVIPQRSPNPYRWSSSTGWETGLKCTHSVGMSIRVLLITNILCAWKDVGPTLRTPSTDSRLHLCHLQTRIVGEPRYCRFARVDQRPQIQPVGQFPIRRLEVVWQHTWPSKCQIIYTYPLKGIDCLVSQVFPSQQYDQKELVHNPLQHTTSQLLPILF